ncbi:MULTISPECIES: hypothetical protein [unclassified Microcoleus]|uniref:hypothetical protein n=1 Tax=unclassified Microcoleus TaxID=2642155 RepID=UPI002FD62F04
MLKQVLNLVPVKILERIGSSIVEILHEKDELRNWQPDQSDVAETFGYMNLEIKIVACAKLNYWYWYWFVCDGRSADILRNGTATTENDAIALALKWANAFLADDSDTLAEEEIDV